MPEYCWDLIVIVDALHGASDNSKYFIIIDKSDRKMFDKNFFISTYTLLNISNAVGKQVNITSCFSPEMLQCSSIIHCLILI